MTPPTDTAHPIIRVLPPHVVNRIAAGEVVDRPASVVKELIENAIDAKATRIEVLVGQGGRSLRVADNGLGMDEANAQKAFLNHATSKIVDVDDLDTIATLGFRGEALASIASVSHLTCTTRQADAAMGIQVTVDALGIPALSPIGCAVGTVMQVDELFYNTPARLKFLKKPATEVAHVVELVQQLALAYPDIQFHCAVDGKPQLSTSGQGDGQLTIGEVFPQTEFKGQWLGVNRQDPTLGYGVQGWITTPTVQKGTKRWLMTYVNGRAVKCPIMAKAVEGAYETLLPPGRYPAAVIFLTLPLDAVDVNVHPTKREVRYVQSSIVFSLIKQTLRMVLEAAGAQVMRVGLSDTGNSLSSGFPSNPSFGAAPTAGNSRGFSAGMSQGVSQPWQGQRVTPTAVATTHQLYTPLKRPDFNSPQPTDASVSHTAAASNTPEPFRVVGQLFNTYILVETRQGLVVVDQHIASERYWFERFKTAQLSGETVQQERLVPIAIALSDAQQSALIEHADQVRALGFAWTFEAQEASVDGAVQCWLTATPQCYAEKHDPKDWFEQIVAQLAESPEVSLNTDDHLATMACHTAVRAGDTLSHEVMTHIVGQWLTCQLPWSCPHGRPIAHTIGVGELNQLFHRPSLPVNAF